MTKQSLHDSLDGIVKWGDATTRLDLPIAVARDEDGNKMSPIELIQPVTANDTPEIKAERLADKAAITITRTGAAIEITTKKSNGHVTVVPNTYTTGKGKNKVTHYPVTTGSSFTDNREGKVISPIDINVGELLAHPDLSGLFADGIVVYVNNVNNRTGTAKNQAVRLLNGTNLPDTGLTFATPDPMYVKGDYNTTTRSDGTYSPSMLAADAITMQSNNWNDSNSTKDISKRIPSETTLNSVLLLGNVPTTEDLMTYSGGLENLIRFMEQWTGSGHDYKFKFNGSFICLWDSLVGRGPWGRSNVYVPPVREWGYDEMYRKAANAPPGVPSFCGMEKLGWDWTNLADFADETLITITE